MSDLVVVPNQPVAKSRSGLAGTEIEMRRETAAIAVAERSKAEVTARYQMALLRPRNTDEARQRILSHCKRPRFAEAARYSKPIGNQAIVGPSIRFVEAALAEYGNVLVQSNVIWDDANERRVTVSVTDLERNICYPKEIVIRKTVEKRFLKEGQKPISQRLNSYGKPVYLVAATEDEMATKQAALESKAIRTLGLRVLPSDIVDEAMTAVVATVRNADAEDPSAARKQVADAFATLGIYPKALEEYVGHPLEQITPSELADLRLVYATVAAQEATWAELLELKTAERSEETSPNGEETTPKPKPKGAKAALEKRRASKSAKAKSKAEKEAAAAQALKDAKAAQASADEPPSPEEVAARIRAELEAGNVSQSLAKEIHALPDDLKEPLVQLFDEVSK